MNALQHTWRVYATPGAVFQSLMVGGGYGTGREIVEYFSRFGVVGGYLGLALTATCFAVLLPISYEFARTYRAYDYAHFSRKLLGRYWIGFEVVYLLMFALVLAVVASASGSLAKQYLHVPGISINIILLLLILLVTFYGREWVTRVLAYKAAVLCIVLLIYFAAEIARSGQAIVDQVARVEVRSGWALAAFRYCLYSSVVIPAMLFATRPIQQRREAIVSGVISAAMGVLPAVLLHTTFAAGYPSVIDKDIPVYTMISSLNWPVLTAAYLAILFGSLFDVGIGFIQSINERVSNWSEEKRGALVTPIGRAGIALFCMLVSGALSLLGIVRLIAQGYGFMAYLFLVLFVAPLLTIGLYRLTCSRSLPALQTEALNEGHPR
jgi:uncharacterized membrane protein YkvI